ncbi:MAG: molybdenum cofactor guanylyltransferase [Acidimicrobiaceae bacterium]|nr:molybdenum cofactor guanylyltransferase [Acidimicrobiaceae bacterium]
MVEPGGCGCMGAVLAGGASSRMGTDKAFIVVDGEPMVLRAARALQAAGVRRTVVVGGDEPRLKALGLETLADDHPGEGPLGAVLTALTSLQGAGVAQRPDIVLHETGIAQGADAAAGGSRRQATGPDFDALVTLPCDALSPDPAAIRCLIESFASDCAEPDGAEAEVIVPLGGGEPQWMHALWRSSCLDALSAAFAEGLRAPRQAAQRLRIATVEVPGSVWFDDADQPEELP